MSYTAYYTELHDVHKAPNSDNLYVATCMNEGVIVGADAYEGQRVFYFPADGCLDYDFAMKFNLMRKDKDGNPAGGYLDYPSCHIRAIKLRGNRSEGIAIDAAKVLGTYDDGTQFKLGDQMTHIAGKEVCKKYIPKKKANTCTPRSSYKGRKTSRMILPDFAMHADTEQLDYNLDAFRPDDVLNLSLKMHGTSQRSMRTMATIQRRGLWGVIARLLHIPEKKKEVYACGTRRTVIQDFDGGRGFYGTDEFRRKHHERIAPYVRLGMEVFYEVVGYYGPGEDQTIMPVGDNSKIGDKDFVKEFGKKSRFVYGCEPGESKMYVYRINDGGREYTPQEIMNWCELAGVDHVPYLFGTVELPYHFTTAQALLDKIDHYFEDLHDPVGKDHIKEGVVVRILNRPVWRAYKKKTYEFKVIEGIIKMTSDVPDMEEADEENCDPDYKDGGMTH